MDTSADNVTVPSPAKNQLDCKISLGFPTRVSARGNKVSRVERDKEVLEEKKGKLCFCLTSYHRIGFSAFSYFFLWG